MRVTSERPLLLASASPRRRELLSLAGVPFAVHAVDVDESARDGEAPIAYLERVTLAKLEAARAIAGGRVAAILVADTIVVASGVLLGKPANAAHARAMIAQLQGRTHEVSTRFAIALPQGRGAPAHAQTVTTRVTLRAMSREEIDVYAASGEGLDKAGGYAVQGRAAALVERIDGSYTNVVGLPLCEVIGALRALP